MSAVNLASLQPVVLNPQTTTSKCIHGTFIVALTIIMTLGALALLSANGAQIGCLGVIGVKGGMILFFGSWGVGMVEVAILITKRERLSAPPDLERSGLIEPVTRRTCCATRYVNGAYAPNPLENTVENIELMHYGGFRKYPPLPKQLPELYDPSPTSPLEGQVDIRWMGHASWLIRAGDVTILTDPNWSETIPFMRDIPLYYRSIDPGLKFDEVPEVTHICQSHTHRDHFDPPTLKKFADRYNPHIYCPQNAAKLLDGITTNITELNWWEEKVLSDKVKITYLPATHASQTTALDCNEYLWGGYLITIKLESGEDYKIYFMGDSACNMNPHIKGFVPYYWKEDTEKFHDIKTMGPFDTVICGIDPIDGQENMHASIYQLPDLFNRMTPKHKLIPMHYGTWPFNRWGRDLLAPVRLFKGQVDQYPSLKEKYQQMKVGERITLVK